MKYSWNENEIINHYMVKYCTKYNWNLIYPKHRKSCYYFNFPEYEGQKNKSAVKLIYIYIQGFHD